MATKIPMAHWMHATGWPPSSWAAKVSWLMINQLIKQLLHQDLYMYILCIYIYIERESHIEIDLFIHIILY